MFWFGNLIDSFTRNSIRCAFVYYWQASGIAIGPSIIDSKLRMGLPTINLFGVEVKESWKYVMARDT
jgi:hypothetical protein